MDKPYGKSRKFKFLGLEYDLDERTVTLRKRSGETRTLNIDTASYGQLEQLSKYTSYGTDSRRAEVKTVNANSMVGRVSD